MDQPSSSTSDSLLEALNMKPSKGILKDSSSFIAKEAKLIRPKQSEAEPSQICSKIEWIGLEKDVERTPEQNAEREAFEMEIKQHFDDCFATWNANLTVGEGDDIIEEKTNGEDEKTSDVEEVDEKFSKI